MFNTLKYAKMLEEVGFSRSQAETSIKILVEIMEDKLASKQDLKDLDLAMKQDFKDLDLALKQEFKDFKLEMKSSETAMKQDFQDLKVEIKNSMSLLESRMTVRMGTMLAASIAILTAIQKLT